jgi:very-short-patch-repair endonuclease
VLVAIDVAEVVGETGWITVPDLLTRVSRRTIGAWVAQGKLVRVRPGVVALPAASGDWRTRLAAALDGRAAVASHATALALWDLIDHPPGPVHVTVDVTASGRGPNGVVLHRSPGIFDRCRLVGGLAVTSVERSIVDTWGRPTATHRSSVRAATITAVRRRLCVPRELTAELERRPRLGGRAELSRLVSLLTDGCQSELEIWGVREILNGPGMPRFVQQHPVALASGTVRLDAAIPELKVAVELDGAAFHGSAEARERDTRGDAALAARGWVVLRFSYRRLMRDPEGCRREILEVCRARRALLAPR